MADTIPRCPKCNRRMRYRASRYYCPYCDVTKPWRGIALGTLLLGVLSFACPPAPEHPLPPPSSTPDSTETDTSDDAEQGEREWGRYKDMITPQESEDPRFIN